MVSSDIVRGDREKISKAKTDYTSALDSINGSWQGSSYDSLTSQAQNFISEFFPTIDEQMEAFAQACDKYKEYTDNKSNLKIANEKLNYYRDRQSNRTKNAKGEYTIDYSNEITNWQNKVTEYTQIKNDLTTEINKALSEASSKTLTATAISETDFSGEAVSAYAPKSIPKLSNISNKE